MSHSLRLRLEQTSCILHLLLEERFTPYIYGRNNRFMPYGRWIQRFCVVFCSGTKNNMG